MRWAWTLLAVLIPSVSLAEGLGRSNAYFACVENYENIADPNDWAVGFGASLTCGELHFPRQQSCENEAYSGDDAVVCRSADLAFWMIQMVNVLPELESASAEDVQAFWSFFEDGSDACASNGKGEGTARLICETELYWFMVMLMMYDDTKAG